MWRVLVIAFLLVHAAIHLAIWATPAPKDPNAPFDARHSWLLGDQRAVAAVLALAAAVLLAGRPGPRPGTLPPPGDPGSRTVTA